METKEIKMSISSISSAMINPSSITVASAKGGSSAAEEATEPLSVTENEAKEGDQQAIQKLASEGISPNSSNGSGILNIKA